MRRGGRLAKLAPEYEAELKALMGVADRMLSVGTTPCTACRSCEQVCPQQIKTCEVMADFSAKPGRFEMEERYGQ